LPLLGLLKFLFKPVIGGFLAIVKNRNLILAVTLSILLLTGFYIFRGGVKEEKTKDKKSLEEIEAVIFQAENALIFKDEKLATELFQEALNNLLPLIEGNYLIQTQKEASILKESIEESIADLE